MFWFEIKNRRWKRDNLKYSMNTYIYSPYAYERLGVLVRVLIADVNGLYILTKTYTSQKEMMSFLYSRPKERNKSLTLEAWL